MIWQLGTYMRSAQAKRVRLFNSNTDVAASWLGPATSPPASPHRQTPRGILYAGPGHPGRGRAMQRPGVGTGAEVSSLPGQARTTTAHTGPTMSSSAASLRVTNVCAFAELPHVWAQQKCRTDYDHAVRTKFYDLKSMGAAPRCMTEATSDHAGSQKGGVTAAPHAEFVRRGG